jgi:hypothetical protein
MAVVPQVASTETTCPFLSRRGRSVTAHGITHLVLVYWQGRGFRWRVSPERSQWRVPPEPVAVQDMPGLDGGLVAFMGDLPGHAASGELVAVFCES